MRVVVITPADPVISLEEAKEHLKVLASDDDALITSMVAAATAHIDGPDGWLGRSIGVQTLEARFYLPNCSVIRLPFKPVIGLVSVKYLDFNDVEQTADNADFQLYGADLGPVASQWPWEGGSMRREAGRVQYQAGYAVVPAPIRAAILLMVGDLYKFRQTSITGTIASEIPMSTTVTNLLGPFRIWS